MHKDCEAEATDKKPLQRTTTGLQLASVSAAVLVASYCALQITGQKLGTMQALATKLIGASVLSLCSTAACQHNKRCVTAMCKQWTAA